MGISGHARAAHAIVLTCVLAWFGIAANPAAATPKSVELPESIGQFDEPFGFFGPAPSRPPFDGGLGEKWLSVQRGIDDELLVLALCEEDLAHCASPAARQFLAIVDSAKARDGRARLGEINRAINLAIRPVSDILQYGDIDVWSSPLATLARGAGDCEDYAIAKLAALRQAGVAAEDLRLLVLHDPLRNEDHAVVAARLEGRWLTLDNRRMAMVEDAQVRNLRPTFLIDRDGIRRYDAVPSLPELDGRNPASVSSIAE